MTGKTVVIALGSNLGNSEAILTKAIEEIAEFVAGMRTSSYYQSAPVGGPVQPDYLNAVIIGQTELGPEELLTQMQSIESANGRVRNERWGPRTLDIDLVDYDSTLWKSEILTLPHPRAHERAFVLMPWNEIDPDAILIGHGSIKSLLASLGEVDVMQK